MWGDVSLSAVDWRMTPLHDEIRNIKQNKNNNKSMFTLKTRRKGVLYTHTSIMITGR